MENKQEQKERPKYSHIEHEIREKFKLSLNEYGIADSIYKLSSNPNSKYPGWCYASKESIGEWIGISRQGATYIINSLIKKRLVEKNPDVYGQIRTTKIWYENVITYIPKHL